MITGFTFFTWGVFLGVVITTLLLWLWWAAVKYELDAPRPTFVNRESPPRLLGGDEEWKEADG